MTLEDAGALLVHVALLLLGMLLGTAFWDCAYNQGKKAGWQAGCDYERARHAKEDPKA